MLRFRSFQDSLCRISDLKRRHNDKVIIPSHMAWDACIKLIQLQQNWLDFFMSNVQGSYHGVAAVMYSGRSFKKGFITANTLVDASWPRSSAELRDILVEVMTLHPIKEFDKIIQLNDRLSHILEAQREAYANTTTGYDETQYKRDYSFVNFFNNYMEFVVLANYLYPFTDLMHRFHLELEILTTKHVFAESRHSAVSSTPVNSDTTDESIYLHLFFEFLQRDLRPKVKQVAKDFKLLAARQIYKAKKMDYSGVGTDAGHLAIVEHELTIPLETQFTPNERAVVSMLLENYLYYAFGYKNVNYIEFGKYLRNDHMLVVYPNHLLYLDEIEVHLSKFYQQYARIDPSYLSKQNRLDSLFVSFNHEGYRKEFRSLFENWYQTTEISGSHRALLPSFIKTTEDLEISLSLPVYRNNSFNMKPFGVLLKKYNRGLQMTREAFYEFASLMLEYDIHPRPLKTPGEYRLSDFLTEAPKPKKIVPKRSAKKKSKNKKVASDREDSPSSSNVETLPTTAEQDQVEELEDASNPQDTKSIPENVRKDRSSERQPTVPKEKPRTLCESVDTFKTSQQFKLSDFEIDSKDLRVLCIIYGEGKGIVKWNSFTKLLGTLGFRMDRDRAGSRVGFVLEKMKNIPLVVHQPHPVNVMSRLMLKVATKKLEEIGIIPQKFRVSK